LLVLAAPLFLKSFESSNKKRFSSFTAATADMPKNTSWVKWRKHPAREVILQDLDYGGWLYDELKQDEELNLATVFAIYNHKHPE
jgi:hypothetical protein